MKPSETKDESWGGQKQRRCSPRAYTRAKKLQLSVFLPNVDDWYAGVYALPIVWTDVSMLGADNLRKVAGYDFHLLRKEYESRACGVTLTHNGDSWRASSRPKDLTGFRPLSQKSGFLQTSRIGLEMTWKRHCAACWWRHCGVAGLVCYAEPDLAVANLLHSWCFPANKRFSLTCASKSGGTNHFPSIYPHSGRGP